MKYPYPEGWLLPYRLVHWLVRSTHSLLSQIRNIYTPNYQLNTIIISTNKSQGIACTVDTPSSLSAISACSSGGKYGYWSKAVRLPCHSSSSLVNKLSIRWSKGGCNLCILAWGSRACRCLLAGISSIVRRRWMIERSKQKVYFCCSKLENPGSKPLSSARLPICCPYIRKPLRGDQKVDILSILCDLGKNLIRSKIFLCHQAQICNY